MSEIDWPLREKELLREFPDLLPSLAVDSLSRANDSIAVTGSVAAHLAATATLTVNGYRVPLEQSGAFSAIVRLQGQSGLILMLRTDMGRTVMLDVPLRAA